jgi:putative DNA primase/helicase
LASVSEVCDLYVEEMKRQAMIRIDSLNSSEDEKDSKAKKLEDALSKRIQNLQTLRRKKAVVQLAKVGDGSLGISGEEWDRTPWALPVSNGVIDLHTGEFRSGVPADFFKTVAPTKWLGLNEKCPRWEKFLQEIFDEDAKLISFMHRLLGYSVTGLTVEHILLMLCGIGRNGKSTLIEIIGHVLGKISGQGDPELILEGRFNRISGAPSSDIMALRGKRLVWISETSEGKRLSPGRVKWLTGGDTLTGRGIREKHQTSFTPTHTLFLLTNAKPKANAQDFALWKRVLLIPFNLSFVNEPDPLKPNERKADLHLLEKLKAEAPGILAWLVRGCLAWQKEGLNPPPKVKIATAQYREDEDILKRFIEERCITGETYSVRAQGFYEAYTQHAKVNGESAISLKLFGGYMTKKFKSTRDSKGKFYHGIGLL